jgi:hypothetical protein
MQCLFSSYTSVREASRYTQVSNGTMRSTRGNRTL